MSEAETPTPTTTDLTKHAPDAAQSPLGLMSLISILLGVLFLIGWKFGSVNAELATEDESRRLLFLFWVGWFLFGWGIAIGLFHVARDPHYATGADEALQQKLAGAGLFLRLAYLPVVILGHRRARGFANRGVQVVLGVALFALANYVFARHELWRIDVTSSQVFTLSEESRTIVAEIEFPVRLLTIVPQGGLPDGLERELETLVQEYREANPRIRGEFFNTLSVSDPVEREKKLKALGVTGDLSNDQAILGLIVQIGKLTEGEFEVVRSERIALHDLWQADPSDPTGRKQSFNGERRVTTALLELQETKRSLVYFLDGHGEPSIGGMDGKGLAYWVERLRERNMDVKTLNLIQEANGVVPADADLLIVAGPRSQLTPKEIKAIDGYLREGGDMIYLAEGRYETAAALRTVEWLEMGLENIVRDRYGILLTDRVVKMLAGDPSTRRMAWVSDYPGVGLQLSHRHPLVHPLIDPHPRPIYLRSVRPMTQLTVPNVVTESLIKSVVGKEKAYMGQADPTSSQRGKEGPYHFAMAAEAHDETGKTGPKTPSRVVVIGDVDVATTELVAQRSFANLELLLNAVHWCLGHESRVVGKVKVKEPTRLVMTKNQVTQLQLISVFGLPALAIALGIVAFVIRRRA